MKGPSPILCRDGGLYSDVFTPDIPYLQFVLQCLLVVLP